MLSSKIEKILKKFRIGSFFSNLNAHNNFRQTNLIQLEFFNISSMLGILQQNKELSSHKKIEKIEKKT